MEPNVCFCQFRLIYSISVVTSIDTLVIYLCHTYASTTPVSEDDVHLHDHCLHVMLNEFMSLAAGVTGRLSDDSKGIERAHTVVAALGLVLHACVLRAKVNQNVSKWKMVLGNLPGRSSSTPSNAHNANLCEFNATVSALR